jgi:NitT/TauT family transport system ATP-binding protein
MICVEEIKKSFNVRGAPVVAVDAVSCIIEPHSFVTLVGPSGCGKSTLLQIIAGLVRSTRGRVTFRGEDVTRPPFDMVYVFQQYTKSIFPWKTVRENVAFGLRHRKRQSTAEINAVVTRYIHLMGLEGFERHYPSQLSGGMQQRVAIARALACQPAVLLMDEPFSSLDEFTRASLQDLTIDIWRRHQLTILFVTHDVEEAVYLSTRALVMSPRPGRIADDIAIHIPYPRSQLSTRERPDFLEYRRRIFRATFGEMQETRAELPA